MMPCDLDPATARRFTAKFAIDSTTGCWLWTGAQMGEGAQRGEGYGIFAVRYAGEAKLRRIAAHRWSYLYHVGPIPEGLELDHLCRVRRCVNPAHLEPVTHAENLLRGETWNAAHAEGRDCGFDGCRTCQPRRQREARSAAA